MICQIAFWPAECLYSDVDVEQRQQDGEHWWRLENEMSLDNNKHLIRGLPLLTSDPLQEQTLDWPRLSCLLPLLCFSTPITKPEHSLYTLLIRSRTFPFKTDHHLQASIPKKGLIVYDCLVQDSFLTMARYGRGKEYTLSSALIYFLVHATLTNAVPFNPHDRRVTPVYRVDNQGSIYTSSRLPSGPGIESSTPLQASFSTIVIDGSTGLTIVPVATALASPQTVAPSLVAQNDLVQSAAPSTQYVEFLFGLPLHKILTESNHILTESCFSS